VHGSNARNLSISLFLSQASKNAVFLFIPYVFSSTESEKRAELVWGGGGEEVPQTMYTHVSKCKNNKIFKNQHWITSYVFSRFLYKTFTYSMGYPINPSTNPHRIMIIPSLQIGKLKHREVKQLPEAS
jgi:hypothetical protein